MAKAKEYRAQAQNTEGAIIFDETSKGAKTRRALYLKAFHALNGQSGLVRTQQVGAAKWAVYTYQAGDKWAHYAPRHPWASAG